MAVLLFSVENRLFPEPGHRSVSAEEFLGVSILLACGVAWVAISATIRPLHFCGATLALPSTY